MNLLYHGTVSIHSNTWSDLKARPVTNMDISFQKYMTSSQLLCCSNQVKVLVNFPLLWCCTKTTHMMKYALHSNNTSERTINSCYSNKRMLGYCKCCYWWCNQLHPHPWFVSWDIRTDVRPPGKWLKVLIQLWRSSRHWTSRSWYSHKWCRCKLSMGSQCFQIRQQTSCPSSL